MAKPDEFSDPCRFCGGRFWVAPGGTRASERAHHERVCDLSIDCPYCHANIGERCVVRKTGKPSETHQSRRFASEAW